MEEFKRNLEETNVIRSEKSSAMEDKYSQSPDPWKNGERGIYYPMMEKLISELFVYSLEQIINIINLAGFGLGIGSGRTSGYGRYHVEEVR